jgi:hypothetical protein
MTPDDTNSPMERAYPYCNGWQAACCSSLAFGVLGGVGVALLPYGIQQVRNGPLPLGIALVMIGVFTLPMLFLALFVVISGVRDAIRPPLLRVTPTALLLPPSLRDLRADQEEQDDRGEPKDLSPPAAHPAELPITAIRWVRREEGSPGTLHRLMIVHDLSDRTLVIEQAMMRREDFDELETVLRAAIPATFAPAPPSS